MALIIQRLRNNLWFTRNIAVLMSRFPNLRFEEEARITVGCGTTLILGLLCRKRGCTIRIVAFTAGFIVLWLIYRHGKQRWTVSEQKAVLITSCDSGLGLSLALHTHRMGLTVIAACLDLNEDGAKKLKTIFGPSRLFLIEMDVTDEDSVNNAVCKVQAILRDNQKLELKVLVNNAATLTFGEFEWQIERMICNQVEVNFVGTMRVTKAFMPLMRRNHTRIITVTSHRVHHGLPGLAVYGGTQAALKAWSKALRKEQSKYGIEVILFALSPFAQQNNLMSKHNEVMKEMKDVMAIQDRIFYGDYFNRYHGHVKKFGRLYQAQSLDEELYKKYEEAVLSRHPRAYYEHAPRQYAIDHVVSAICPTLHRDIFINWFMDMPRWCND